MKGKESRSGAGRKLEPDLKFFWNQMRKKNEWAKGSSSSSPPPPPPSSLSSSPSSLLFPHPPLKRFHRFHNPAELKKKIN